MLFLLKQGEALFPMNLEDKDYRVLKEIAKNYTHPLLFLTVSGAHLYGFPSSDSDFDLRGAHILPDEEIFGLEVKNETLQATGVKNNYKVDMVTHDIKKFFKLLLRKNGYVLEQLYSPLNIYQKPEHEELKVIARGCITRHHAHHYLGFSKTQWRLFQKNNPPYVKPLLYVFRVVLTGIYLMRTGKVEANLLRLNHEFNLPYIPELIARKTQGGEKAVLEQPDIPFYEQEFKRLYRELEEACEKSVLPDKPATKQSLNDFLIRLRKKYAGL